MILDSYVQFAGCDPVLILDTGDISTVVIPPHRLPGALALARAEDVVAFELVLNVGLFPLDQARIVCPDCDGTGCRECAQRGTVTPFRATAIQVLASDGSEVRIVSRVGDDGEVSFEEPEPSESKGLLKDVIARVAESPQPVPLSDLLVFWGVLGDE